ncbi:MAG: hypothetical protein JXA99_08240 [Candidatus Lokiarchaeota archaeon]|nr:hypothetical protein [Candidatus Lokiarchaeota archaeon]
MTIIEGKYAYPYITVFKKEPFRSFVLLKPQDIGSFYFSKYDRITEFFQLFTKNLFNITSLSIEDIYWYVLMSKYLKEEIHHKVKEKIFSYIRSCEIDKDGKLGFKSHPQSNQKKPDIWSTYFAIVSFYLMGDLKEFMKIKGEAIARSQIKDFINSLDKGDRFRHCLKKDCEVCKKGQFDKTLYFILELFTILNIEVREHKSKFSSYIGDLKKDPSLVFKLLSLKFLGLELNVEEKSLQYLHSFQKENGGYSFKTENGKANTTFWITYALDNYTWLMDYNPSGIYSFINIKLGYILDDRTSWSSKKLIEASKLIIIFSIIWDKFIEEIERVIFKQIEDLKYIDVKQLKSLFGLNEVINEVISYINLNYSFKLKILDNKIEFKNYIRRLNPSEKILATELYKETSNKTIISLTDILKKYNMSYSKDQIKIKDFIAIITKMIKNNFLRGEIKTKKKYLFITKYYFYLEYLLEKIITSDTKITYSQLFDEKKRVQDIKNDIYNMTLKLRNASSQIKEEIESYLYINEIRIAKERLKFITRNALMEADFLNENIENSFNEDLYYVNIQAILRSEITDWHRSYAVLSKKIKDVESQLKEKILEKEEIHKFDNILDELDNKLSNLENYFNKEIDKFRHTLNETLEDGYSSQKFNLIVNEFNKIIKSMEKFDKAIYNVSQQITRKDEGLIKKHKELINYWIKIKEELDKIIDYYSGGLNFFKENTKVIQEIYKEVESQLLLINERAHQKVKESDFQNAFEMIKRESGLILQKNLDEIKSLQKNVKKEIKTKQKLNVLFKYLQQKLEKLEDNIIKTIAKENYSIQEKVSEERNRSKHEKFDNFVSDKISYTRNKINNYKTSLEHKIKESNVDIQEVINDFNSILEEFETFNAEYNKKLNKYKNIVKDFEDESDLTIMQWNRFVEYIHNEVKTSKEEYINQILNDKILMFAEKKGTNYVSIKDLAKKLNIKCKEATDRIKEMIDISQISGEINEDEKFVLVYTNYYYKNKELRNFIYNQIIKYNNETIGKTLSLYDSCIKNRTLGINMFELSNRVKDLKNFDTEIEERFENKIKELGIDIEDRQEYKETKDYFRNIVDDSKTAIQNIAYSLEQYKSLQHFINIEFGNINIEFSQKFLKIGEEIEKLETYEKMKSYFDNARNKLDEKIEEKQQKIEDKLKSTIDKDVMISNLEPELREFYVKIKNAFTYEYNEKIKNIENKINFKKNEILQGELLNFINNSKIQLNQLLGVLQTRVEDDIEIKEFKRAISNIDKRIDNIKVKMRQNKKDLKDLIRILNRESKDFETKNKYILDDYNQYFAEYYAIITEKTKTLEGYILKSFIDMAIKAVSNEYLTLSFMNKELGIKKQNIQDHLLALISQDKLNGKYDPRLGIYYENPEIIANLNETELEVMKKMNFKVYMFLNRLKNFTSHYYSIIGFFASMLTFSYYLLLFSNWNPAVLIIPSIIVIILLYFLFSRRKENKMDI